VSKNLFALLVLGGAITFLLVACATTSADTSSTPNQVHMNTTDFVSSSITIKKGERITLIDDTLTPHIIANGIWENGTAKPTREPGVPEVKDVQINGFSQGTIGPFTIAGTFHFYCTIHSSMNLTVIVQ